MIEATSLIVPAGPLHPDLFPGDADLAGTISGFLDIAYESPEVLALSQEGDQDAAAYNYAMWKAYEAIFNRMSGTPLSTSLIDEGSVGYSNEQIRNFKFLMEKYEDLYQTTIIPALSVRVANAPSGSVTNRFRF